MQIDAYDAARLLSRTLAVAGADRWMSDRSGGTSRITRGLRAAKHALALRSRDAHRWFIRPYYGLRLGMSFRELCDWLNTPAGSDAFADRHWLSQSLQLRSADGRLPDFLGSYERLDADWRAIAEHVGMPFDELPRLNVRTTGQMAETALDDDIVALLHLRYARDFELAGYTADGPPWGAGAT